MNCQENNCLPPLLALHCKVVMNGHRLRFKGSVLLQIQSRISASESTELWRYIKLSIIIIMCKPKNYQNRTWFNNLFGL